MRCCKNCKHWRKIRDEDLETEEGSTWDGPHGECRAIDEFSTDNPAWLHAHIVRQKEDGTLTDGSDCHSDLSLITQEDFKCDLHEYKETATHDHD